MAAISAVRLGPRRPGSTAAHGIGPGARPHARRRRSLLAGSRWPSTLCNSWFCQTPGLSSGQALRRPRPDHMRKPAILTVDDDPMVSAAITRDMRSRYGADYRIVRATSGSEALDVLTKLALRDQPVALIAADQRMPQMTGIQMLGQARTHAPEAKYVLLTAYADTDVAIKAINEIGLDYYLLKPWDPPEERLYPVID